MTPTPLRIAAFLCLLIHPAAAQFGESTYQVPAGLVRGGAFIDHFLPMPWVGKPRSDVWGVDAVKPRDVDNGIEDAEFSYWCTAVVKGPDGKYHNFACRWREDSPKGHFEWPKSIVVHSVADHPLGPYKVTEEIGKGHNVDAFQLKDRSWVLYVIGASYRAPSINGPWTRGKLDFDTRGRESVDLSNCTFVRREDGSILMLSRTGFTWVSRDGHQPFRMVSNSSAYPPVGKARFEDPVIWKDDVQYHLIVNDWFGRTAFYLRSRDGVKWDWDQGKAYAPGIFRHDDGTLEDWHKIERPKVLQDEIGRATHMFFAVIDDAKEVDKPNDNHSSKAIGIPLGIPRPMRITGSGETLTVTLASESGFNPQEVKTDSVRFGSPSKVDFGQGAKPLSSTIAGGELVMSFKAADCGIADIHAAAKLLAEDAKGGLVYSYALPPGAQEMLPLLSADARVACVRDVEGALTVRINVGNFGPAASGSIPLHMRFRQNGASDIHLKGMIPALQPFSETTLALSLPSGKWQSEKDATLLIHIGEQSETEGLDARILCPK